MMRKRVKKITALILCLCFLLASFGCTDNTDKKVLNNEKDESLQKVMDAGKLVVGIDGDFLAMAFKDENGEYVGYDIDIASEVCSRLGIEMEIKVIDWAQKEEYLNNGLIDCIWSAMSITPERAKAMNLSDPYLQTELIFIVPEECDAISVQDLKGKTIGVQKGTTSYDVLYESDIKNDVSIVLDKYNILLTKLQQGKIDAVLIDSTFAYYFIYRSEKKFYVLSESLGGDKYAVGFRKGDQKLRDKIQEEMDKLRSEGELSRISEKWFGSDITTVN
jgi:polar amino acid transport system substrate-binding protein